MRLSEAIRLGATLHPQSYGKMFEKYPRPPRQIIPYWGPSGVRATCAIGAAAAAIGVRASRVWDSFPALDWNVISPIGGALQPVEAVIVHMNDQMKWSREHIADWVEQVEREQEGVQVQEELASVYEGVGER